LDHLFKQLIADEEAKVLRILIDTYGVKGAGDAIKFFRRDSLERLTRRYAADSRFGRA
jgi:hypothetical protein